VVRKIYWTDSAKSRLRDIYTFYKLVAGVQVAQNIKSRIFEKAQLLSENPQLGSIELGLDYLGLGHRYLVSGNFKIIYLLQGSNVFITDVFDTRQNPETINPSES
jgi:toxin ParE1/3/4